MQDLGIKACETARVYLLLVFRFDIYKPSGVNWTIADLNLGLYVSFTRHWELWQKILNILIAIFNFEFVGEFKNEKIQ